jgi:cytochrome c
LKVLSIIISSLFLFLTAACSSDSAAGKGTGKQTTSNLMIHYGCPTCHVISGVPGAAGKVGPSLNNLVQRSYLAGTLQNTPDNLALWIQHPQRIHPGTAMPEMGVTPADAKNIAAFLEASR